MSFAGSKTGNIYIS